MRNAVSERKKPQNWRIRRKLFGPEMPYRTPDAVENNGSTRLYGRRFVAAVFAYIGIMEAGNAKWAFDETEVAEVAASASAISAWIFRPRRRRGLSVFRAPSFSRLFSQITVLRCREVRHGGSARHHVRKCLSRRMRFS